MSHNIMSTRMKTYYLTNWKDWEKLCEEYGIDPYEPPFELGVDEGEGNGREYKYIGEVPEKEET